MTSEKVCLLEDLIHDKLHPFKTVRVEKRNKDTCTYIEITLRFELDGEIDHAIVQLKGIPDVNNRTTAWILLGNGR